MIIIIIIIIMMMMMMMMMIIFIANKVMVCASLLYLPAKTFVNQGSTLEQRPWGQLTPKFLDLVTSTNFLVAKNFRPFGPKTFT